MINLDERPDKWKMTSEHLHQFGLYPYRFSAVNGWELSLEALDQIGTKFLPGMQGLFLGTKYPLDKNFEPVHAIIYEYGQTYFSHCMSRGAIGIVLSHLSVLQDAYDAGYETIWVMEDDVLAVQDPNRMSELIEHLDRLVGKGNWDVLFTDPDTKANNGRYVSCFSAAKKPNFYPKNPNNYALREEVSSEFKRIGARYGAYSMILRRSGVELILNFIKEHRLFLPYDMEFYLPVGIRMYAPLNDIVVPRLHAGSDNGYPNYRDILQKITGER